MRQMLNQKLVELEEFSENQAMSETVKFSDRSYFNLMRRESYNVDQARSSRHYE